MTYRNLRIAWSVMWGVLTLLLVLLWVRSYWWSDGFEGSLRSWYFEGATESGQLWAGAYDSGFASEWRVDTLPTTSVKQAVIFGVDYGSYGAVAFTPLWCAAATATVLAVTPWLRWRFCLRTLLVVTTIIATLLWLIVTIARP